MELAHQMWDEARHIEIVAKAVEEDVGGELGYRPRRDALASWDRQCIARIQGFHASRSKNIPDPSEARFTFLKNQRDGRHSSDCRTRG